MPDRKTWIADLYQEILRPTDTPPPGWRNLPALGQLTITRPELLQPFTGHNRRHPAQAVRPGCFVSVCYPKPFARAKPIRLFAPYTTPARALNEIWYELQTGDPYRITTEDPLGDLVHGLVPVKSYGDVATAYANRPETKFAHDGGPCLPYSTGPLTRRHIRATAIEHLGKEANVLGRRAEGGNAREQLQQTYSGSQLSDHELGLLQEIPRGRTAAAAQISTRALQDILTRRSGPRPQTLRALRHLIRSN